MNKLERRAMLGDRQAQDELTKNLYPLPCPCCGGRTQIRYTGNGSGPLGYTTNFGQRSKPGFVLCLKCSMQSKKEKRACVAVKKWNTRSEPPIGRCKDCAQYKSWGECNETGDEVKPDDYCSYFESKEDK